MFLLTEKFIHGFYGLKSILKAESLSGVVQILLVYVAIKH